LDQPTIEEANRTHLAGGRYLPVGEIILFKFFD